MKSQALGIEDGGLADGEALENPAARILIAAVQVMQCVRARGEAAQTMPTARVFASAHMPVLMALTRNLEGKTLKQKNPHPPNTPG